MNSKHCNDYDTTDAYGVCEQCTSISTLEYQVACPDYRWGRCCEKLVCNEGCVYKCSFCLKEEKDSYFNLYGDIPKKYINFKKVINEDDFVNLILETLKNYLPKDIIYIIISYTNINFIICSDCFNKHFPNQPFKSCFIWWGIDERIAESRDDYDI